MSTAVTFETASLADTLRKAARIAPLKGQEFERYAGFYLEVRNDDEDAHVVLRAANGDIFYMERINVLDIEGENVDWRVPSAVTAGVVGALPIGSGKTCVFKQEEGRIRITSGRTKASVRLLDDQYFPEWDVFDSEELELVHGFGEKLDRIAWAVDKKQAMSTSAVYIDGEQVVGTDGNRLAAVPLKMPTGEEPYILVQMAVLAPIISQVVETKVGVIDGYLCLQPNDYTQIKCLILGLTYPPVHRVMNVEPEEAILFNREAATEIINRIMPVISSDRQADLYVTIGNGEMEFFTEDDQKINSIIDVIELPGQCPHEPIKYRFGPDNFVQAITKSPGTMVTMNYDPEKPKQLIRFDGQEEYRCWINPRVMGQIDPQQKGNN